MGEIRATISMLEYGQLCQNVLHFSHSLGSDPEDLSLMADEIHTHWIGNVKLPISGNVQFTSIRIDEIGAGGGVATFTKLVSDVGAQDIDHFIPLNTAWKLRFQTGLAGRRNRGRCYIPGIRTGYNDQGFINALGISQWTTPILNLTNKFSASGDGICTLVIRQRHGAGSDTFQPVTSIQLANTPGSMRSRMIGVGT